MRGDEVQPDFAQFLLARITEDEDEARVFDDATADELEDGKSLVASDEYRTIYATPARVLAECAAKRSIIEAHPYGGDQSMPAHCCADPGDYLGEQMYHDEPCPTLAAMLSVYADHKDFRKEWLG